MKTLRGKQSAALLKDLPPLRVEIVEFLEQNNTLDPKTLATLADRDVWIELGKQLMLMELRAVHERQKRLKPS